MGENNFHAHKEVQQDGSFLRRGQVSGTKMKSEQTSRGMNAITERSQVRRAYKYYARYPWVIRRCPEEKFAHLNSTRGHFIISMEITATT